MHGDGIRTSLTKKNYNDNNLKDFLSFSLTVPGLILPMANAFLELFSNLQYFFIFSYFITWPSVPSCRMLATALGWVVQSRVKLTHG